MDRTSSRIGPPGPFDSDFDHGRDQVVVLQNISWDQYVALSDTREGRHPLMAFLDGELELVTVSFRHEFVKTLSWPPAANAAAAANIASVSVENLCQLFGDSGCMNGKN